MGARINRDVWVGLAFVLLAALMWLGARDLPRGTALRMGPGYIPILLSGLTAALGLLLVLSAAGRARAEAEPWNLPLSLMVVAAILIFGATIRPLGALAAMTLAGIACQLPYLRRQPLAVLGLSLAISATLTAIFVIGLGMTLDVLPGG